MAGKELSLRDRLDQAQASFAALLPATIPTERFVRVVYDAVNRNSELKQCTVQSVVDACSQAAKDHLFLDGREAALVIYKRYKKDRYGKNVKDDQGRWIIDATEAQYIPMVLGLRKRMFATGQISTMETGIVYENEEKDDRFSWQAGTDAHLIHRPLLTDNLGAPIAVYSVVTMANGTKSVEVMRWSDVMRIAKSQTKNVDGEGALKGIWKQHTNEMARKTVLRRHSKQLPFDGDLARMFERVDDLYGGAPPADEEDESEGAGAQPRKQAGAGREKLRQHRQQAAQQNTPERQPDVTDLDPVDEDGEGEDGNETEQDRI